MKPREQWLAELIGRDGPAFFSHPNEVAISVDNLSRFIADVQADAREQGEQHPVLRGLRPRGMPAFRVPKRVFEGVPTVGGLTTFLVTSDGKRTNDYNWLGGLEGDFVRLTVEVLPAPKETP